MVSNKLRVTYHNHPFLALFSVQDSFYTAFSVGKRSWMTSGRPPRTCIQLVDTNYHHHSKFIYHQKI